MLRSLANRILRRSEASAKKSSPEEEGQKLDTFADIGQLSEEESSTKQESETTSRSRQFAEGQYQQFKRELEEIKGRQFASYKKLQRFKKIHRSRELNSVEKAKAKREIITRKRIDKLLKSKLTALHNIIATVAARSKNEPAYKDILKNMRELHSEYSIFLDPKFANEVFKTDILAETAEELIEQVKQSEAYQQAQSTSAVHADATKSEVIKIDEWDHHVTKDLGDKLINMNREDSLLHITYSGYDINIEYKKEEGKLVGKYIIKLSKEDNLLSTIETDLINISATNLYDLVEKAKEEAKAKEKDKIALPDIGSLQQTKKLTPEEKAQRKEFFKANYDAELVRIDTFLSKALTSGDKKSTEISSLFRAKYSKGISLGSIENAINAVKKELQRESDPDKKAVLENFLAQVKLRRKLMKKVADLQERIEDDILDEQWSRDFIPKIKGLMEKINFLDDGLRENVKTLLAKIPKAESRPTFEERSETHRTKQDKTFAETLDDNLLLIDRDLIYYLNEESLNESKIKGITEQIEGHLRKSGEIHKESKGGLSAEGLILSTSGYVDNLEARLKLTNLFSTLHEMIKQGGTYVNSAQLQQIKKQGNDLLEKISWKGQDKERIRNRLASYINQIEVLQATEEGLPEVQQESQQAHWGGYRSDRPQEPPSESLLSREDIKPGLQTSSRLQGQTQPQSQTSAQGPSLAQPPQATNQSILEEHFDTYIDTRLKELDEFLDQELEWDDSNYPDRIDLITAEYRNGASLQSDLDYINDQLAKTLTPDDRAQFVRYYIQLKQRVELIQYVSYVEKLTEEMNTQPLQGLSSFNEKFKSIIDSVDFKDSLLKKYIKGLSTNLSKSIDQRTKVAKKPKVQTFEERELEQLKQEHDQKLDDIDKFVVNQLAVLNDEEQIISLIERENNQGYSIKFLLTKVEGFLKQKNRRPDREEFEEFERQLVSRSELIKLASALRKSINSKDPKGIQKFKAELENFDKSNPKLIITPIRIQVERLLYTYIMQSPALATAPMPASVPPAPAQAPDPEAIVTLFNRAVCPNRFDNKSDDTELKKALDESLARDDLSVRIKVDPETMKDLFGTSKVIEFDGPYSGLPIKMEQGADNTLTYTLPPIPKAQYDALTSDDKQKLELKREKDVVVTILNAMVNSNKGDEIAIDGKYKALARVAAEYFNDSYNAGDKRDIKTEGGNLSVDERAKAKAIFDNILKDGITFDLGKTGSAVKGEVTIDNTKDYKIEIQEILYSRNKVVAKEDFSLKSSGHGHGAAF